MKKRDMSLLVMLSLTLVFAISPECAPALAQSPSQLEGRVNMDVAKTRLSRPVSAPVSVISESNDNKDFTGIAGSPVSASEHETDRSSIDSAFPTLGSKGKGLKGSVEKTKNAQSAPPARKAHIWQVSRLGGYYDATGQIEGTVPGDQLHKYGGFMSDGVTPVPNSPVRTNRTGQIEWSPSWKRNR